MEYIMYLIRRVYNVKPRTAMKVAEVLANVAQIYEKSGSTAKAKIDKMNEKQIYGLMIKIWNNYIKFPKL